MVYLCIIQDLFNNEPVAWTVTDQQVKSLSVETIKQLSQKSSLKGALIHSDQGVHYTNKEYVTLLEKLSVTQSMSRRGNCWDNAKMESFFGLFKSELLYLKHFENIDHLKQEIHAYIRWYNEERIKLHLKGLSPIKYRQQALVVA